MSAYRDDVDALSAREAALAQELTRRQRELDEVGRRLSEARQRPRLPVLDDLRIASPCDRTWASMAGDGRVRHCADCDKDVFDVSALTRSEALRLLAAHGGNLCVTYYQRADGTVLLADCTVGVQRRRRRTLVAAGATAALAGLAAAYFAPRLLADGKPAIALRADDGDTCAAHQRALDAERDAQRLARERARQAAVVQRMGGLGETVGGEELEARRDALAAALAEVEAEHGRVRTAMHAAQARGEAVQLEAAAAAAAARAAQAEVQATRAQLEAERARIEALQLRVDGAAHALDHPADPRRDRR